MMKEGEESIGDGPATTDTTITTADNVQPHHVAVTPLQPIDPNPGLQLSSSMNVEDLFNVYAETPLPFTHMTSGFAGCLDHILVTSNMFEVCLAVVVSRFRSSAVFRLSYPSALSGSSCIAPRWNTGRVSPASGPAFSRLPLRSYFYCGRIINSFMRNKMKCCLAVCKRPTNEKNPSCTTDFFASYKLLDFQLLIPLVP